MDGNLLHFGEWLMLEEKVRIPLPKVEQVSNYDCGPAALRAICQYYKVGPEDHDQFIKDCKTTKKDGTEPEHLIRVAKKYGLKVKEVHGMTIEQLQGYLDEKKPVIVDIQAWGEERHYKKLDSGHYAVAIGYDEKRIYFEDPSVHTRKRGSMLKKIFLDRWKDKKASGEVLTQYGLVMWLDNKKQKDKDHLNATKRIE